VLPPLLAIDGRVARFVYAECSVVRYRGGAVVLYPLVGYQPEVKSLRGKRVHVVMIAKERIRPYKPI
jgi:hypothetical protein